MSRKNKIARMCSKPKERPKVDMEQSRNYQSSADHAWASAILAGFMSKYVKGTNRPRE